MKLSKDEINYIKNDIKMIRLIRFKMFLIKLFKRKR